MGDVFYLARAFRVVAERCRPVNQAGSVLGAAAAAMAYALLAWLTSRAETGTLTGR